MSADFAFFQFALQSASYLLSLSRNTFRLTLCIAFLFKLSSRSTLSVFSWITGCLSGWRAEHCDYMRGILKSLSEEWFPAWSTNLDSLLYVIMIPSCKWMWSVSQLCPTICEPMDCSLSASSVHGTLQGRILEWTVFLLHSIRKILKSQVHVNDIYHSITRAFWAKDNKLSLGAFFQKQVLKQGFWWKWLLGGRT